MNSLHYHNGAAAQIGDIFQAPRWGTCKILSIDPANGATARNTSTGEVFDLLGQATFGEADLIALRHRQSERRPAMITKREAFADCPPWIRQTFRQRHGKHGKHARDCCRAWIAIYRWAKGGEP